MYQKRIQENHFANLKQAFAANEFLINKKLDPWVGEILERDLLTEAPKKMHENSNSLGNMAVFVQSPSVGFGVSDIDKGTQCR